MWMVAKDLRLEVGSGLELSLKEVENPSCSLLEDYNVTK